jgi:hypothetical protein
MSDWQVEPRETPEALKPGFQAERYTDPWNSISERLDSAMRQRLEAFKLLGAAVGGPDAS